ncbi:hypothetical protein [Agrobacterium tumefaciens]|uniref:hypothetical protein n=1 Tax=Agrobacterium tumefaciens TaxID=358 RepID=UPI003BA0402A
MTCLTAKFINIRSAEVGSLVRFDHNGATLFAIILDKGTTTSRMIKIGVDGHTFQQVEMNNDIDGLDLGKAWLFEATDIAASFVEGYEAAKLTGLLTFSDQGHPILSVSDHVNPIDVVYWNLNTRTSVPGRVSVPAATKTWALWANKEERNSPKGKPLYVAFSQKP